MVDNNREKMKKILDFLGVKLVNKCDSSSKNKHYELMLSDGTPLYYKPNKPTSVVFMRRTYWTYEPSVSSLVDFLCNEAVGLYVDFIAYMPKKHSVLSSTYKKNPFYGCKSLDEMLIVIDIDNGEFAQ